MAEPGLTGNSHNFGMRAETRNRGPQRPCVKRLVESPVEPENRLDAGDRQRRRREYGARAIERLARGQRVAEAEHRECDHRIGMIWPALPLQEEANHESARRRE